MLTALEFDTPKLSRFFIQYKARQLAVEVSSPIATSTKMAHYCDLWTPISVNFAIHSTNPVHRSNPVIVDYLSWALSKTAPCVQQVDCGMIDETFIMVFMGQKLPQVDCGMIGGTCIMVFMGTIPKTKNCPIFSDSFILSVFLEPDTIGMPENGSYSHYAITDQALYYIIDPRYVVPAMTSCFILSHQS